MHQAAEIQYNLLSLLKVKLEQAYRLGLIIQKSQWCFIAYLLCI